MDVFIEDESKDTAHFASDIIGFGISIIALKITFKSALKNFTYG